MPGSCCGDPAARWRRSPRRRHCASPATRLASESSEDARERAQLWPRLEGERPSATPQPTESLVTDRPDTHAIWHLHRPAALRHRPLAPASACFRGAAAPASVDQRISIDEFMQGRTARRQGAGGRARAEVEEAGQALGRRRHRAADHRRRHRRGLRARSARGTHDRDRRQPEARQADGHRDQRDGPRRERRRRRADAAALDGAAAPGTKLPGLGDRDEFRDTASIVGLVIPRALHSSRLHLRFRAVDD